MVICLGSDHAGFKLKETIKDKLSGGGFTVEDYGTCSEDSCDYPDYALKVAERVAGESPALGILICKTGVGMSIAANKVPGIRAALCKNPETAKLSREHNDANILALEGGLVPEDARAIVKAWLEAKFLNDRHSKRISKINEIEKKYCIPAKLG